MAEGGYENPADDPYDGPWEDDDDDAGAAMRQLLLSHSPPLRHALMVKKKFQCKQCSTEKPG